MLQTFLFHFSKIFLIYFCIGYSYLKISGTKNRFRFIYFWIIILSISTSILQNFFSYLILFIVHCFLYNIILSKYTQKLFGYSLLLLIISTCISVINFTISSGLATCIWAFLLKQNNTYLILLLLTDLIDFTLIFLLFKIKRLRNGFPYFSKKNSSDYIDLFIIIVCTIIIFIYFILTLRSRETIEYMYIWLIAFCIIFIPIIQKSFFLYHKQKLQIQTLKDYEEELTKVKSQLATALKEKEKIIKSNHEFYHRQESLNRKLDILISQIKASKNTNTEFSEDYSDILNRINNLSNEYISKTSIIPNLEKTGITEIDDMLSYMQSECIKNNIDFILKINCDVKYMITNFISLNQLETLLGDLIRNSIIAINHNLTDFKSIMVIFGIKDSTYTLCIYDSGIPFEINTLLNLGINKASTHLDEGGSGIGFITTFETMNTCNSSFIINEITNNNYSKSLEIKFDNKNEYIIISNRKSEILEINSKNTKRNIILK